ncbi:Ppx/GppA phosphatase family protein [Rhodococcus triatomae]|nr:Ppx/GppA phosphatase [Rhodococcus triatomae BKS 15-14]
MRLAVLDIGSNSAQLQVVDAQPGAPPLPIHGLRVPVRLSEDMDGTGSIGERGIGRVVAAVAAAVEVALQQNVEQWYPFVTAAIRDAANRDVVLRRIEDETGVQPQYLSGEQEGRLTYVAVRRWYGWSAGRLLDIDIGGGSMEIAYGRDAEPDVVISMSLGAGRLTREFFTADPPPACEVKELHRHVRTAVREAADRLRWEGEPRRVIGSSKTFKQLARLAGAAPQREGPFVHRNVTAKQITRWIPRLAALTGAQRAALPGVSRPRAAQILAGAVVAAETMRALQIDALEVSPWALREGVMLEHLARVTDPATSLPAFPLRPRAAAPGNDTAAPGSVVYQLDRRTGSPGAASSPVGAGAAPDRGRR